MAAPETSDERTHGFRQGGVFPLPMEATVCRKRLKRARASGRSPRSGQIAVVNLGIGWDSRHQQKDVRAYMDLRSMHAEFHKAASDVLALALAGKKSEATSAWKWKPLSRRLRQAGAGFVRFGEVG